MIIKGLSNEHEGIIVYSGDTEPCAVYVDGNIVENVSCISTVIEGNPIQYSSEYKQNLFKLQINGNTEQYQGSYTPSKEVNIPDSWTSGDASPVYMLASSTPIELPSEGTWKVILSGTATTTPFDIYISDTQEGLFTGSGITLLHNSNGITENEVTVQSSFYIGCGDTSTGIPMYGEQVYWDELLTNFTLTLERTSPVTVPNPDFPQPIQNAGDSGMSLELRGKNLALAAQVYPNTTEVTIDGRECIKNAGNKGFSFRLSGGFKENTQYTISFDVSVKRNTNPFQGVSPMVFFIKYKDVATDWARDAVQTKDENFTHKVKTTLANRTVDYVGAYYNTDAYDVYIDVNTFMLQEGAITEPVYEPYFTPTTIAIPPSVTVDGTTVPLRFSIYDKIIVDRLNSKVTYLSGTWYTEFNGNESFYQSTFAESSGYGRCYIFAFDIPASGGYCTHFRRVGWLASKTVTNVFSWVEVNSTYNRIAFKTDGNDDDTFANSLAEFKALLKSLYNAGTPVTVLAKLKTSTEYVLYDKANNITTDLGEALLNLPTENQTNIITITSTPSANLSVNYAKWGGRK